MSKAIATATIEGRRKRGRPRKICRGEVEEDLKYNGGKNRQGIATDRREWRKIVLEAKVHNRLWHMRRSRWRSSSLTHQYSGTFCHANLMLRPKSVNFLY
jgi:hypothetical protein